MRIGLLKGVESFRLGAGAFRATSPDGRTRTVYLPAETVVLPVQGLLRVGADRLVSGVRLEPSSSYSRLKINGSSYRGSLRIWMRPKGLTLVNEVGLEDYVRGILPKEIDVRWPFEALKTQAVVARTYALFQRGRHEAEGFDLCAGVHCQMYGGREGETEWSDRAVVATRQEIVTYESRPAQTVYHSCCGGQTETASSVWDTPGEPYLIAQSCRWCRTSPFYSWTLDVSGQTLGDRLARAGKPIGRVKSIKVLDRSKTKRGVRFRVKGTTGTVEIGGNLFRLIVGPDRLRSLRWSGLSKQGDGFRIHGNGWGHGVGLCQWGMKTLAENGRSYAYILTRYYPGVKISRYDP